MVAPTNKSAETLFSLPICVIQFYTHNKTPTDSVGANYLFAVSLL